MPFRCSVTGKPNRDHFLALVQHGCTGEAGTASVRHRKRCLQTFFRRDAVTFSPPSVAASYGRSMYDLAAIAITAACFAVVYVVLWALEKI
jgi:hypothetical protein